MQITEIKAGELIAFIESEQYKRFIPKPITDLRAISQFHNPDADPDDPVLLIAHDEENVRAFVGLLPRNTNENLNMHVFSNTCWWSDPEKGRGIAIPLLLRALKRCNFKFYLADCTPYTKSILEKTGYFTFNEPKQGVRGFMRFYFSDIFAKKYKNLYIIRGLLFLVDTVFNLCWFPFRYYFIQKYKKNTMELQHITTIDKRIAHFIQSRSGNEFIHKSPTILEWIKKYPWVKETSTKESVDYPFSHVVNKFNLDFFVLKKDGEIKAFIAISERDNLVKIPFIYFDEKDLTEVMHTLFLHLLQKKYDSLLVFHPSVFRFINETKLPFIHKKKEIKTTGAANSIFSRFCQTPFLQDGDGDIVFT